MLTPSELRDKAAVYDDLCGRNMPAPSGADDIQFQVEGETLGPFAMKLQEREFYGPIPLPE